MTTVPTIWLIETESAVRPAVGRVAEGDFFLRPHHGVLEVGRVSGGELAWLEQIETEVLPGHEPILDAQARNGGVQRIEATPELVRALEGVAEAADTRGG